MGRNKRVNIIIAAVSYFILLISIPSYGTEESLTIQIYPQAPASQIVKQFAPLATYLKQKLNREVIITISRDHKDHMEIAGNDKADIVFLGPVSYVQTVNTFGKKNIIARIEINGSPLLQGVIFTSASSHIDSLAALKGKRFAFGYQDSTMSHLVPLYMLQMSGVHENDLSKHSFLSDQENVALGVLMGDFDAGAVNAGVFEKYKTRGLKDLAWSPKISEHIFIARAALPEDTVIALKKALFDLNKDSNGQDIMTSIQSGMTGFVPASDDDYDNLRILLKKLNKSTYAP